jgi:hypothetical protein
MNREKFDTACQKVIGGQRLLKGIGTLGEKTLHAVLKEYFEPYNDCKEVKIGSFVADIAGEKGIIEIQTKEFSRLKKKLGQFLEYCDVTVVYPIPVKKYVRWLDPQTGELSDRRKSPKKLNKYDCFKELYKIKEFLDNPKMHICLCLIEAEDIRNLNGFSKDRKRGSTRFDRIPLGLIDEIHLDSPADYLGFIPEGLEGEFSSLDFGKLCGIDRKSAATALNVLTKLGITEIKGKNGRENIYSMKGRKNCEKATENNAVPDSDGNALPDNIGECL